MSLEKKVWGDAMLATVILWVLATPIQFGVGAYFYKGAAKSIWGVWRSSKTSWVTRLIRWGSMDTLVALGTTTGYVASLVLLGLDVSGKGMGEAAVGGMGWFDSSVFLMVRSLFFSYNTECLMFLN
jgi:cation transport ATPase